MSCGREGERQAGGQAGAKPGLTNREQQQMANIPSLVKIVKRLSRSRPKTTYMRKVEKLFLKQKDKKVCAALRFVKEMIRELIRTDALLSIVYMYDSDSTGDVVRKRVWDSLLALYKVDIDKAVVDLEKLVG